MCAVVNAWMQLNRDARRVCKDAVDRLNVYEPSDAFVHICGAFLRKGTETFSAVNVLYANHLEESAQSLIRILFELRINFDCFLNIAQGDVKNAVQRVVDSMMLEKIKQARASGFMGIPEEIKKQLEENEKQIASRYDKDDFNRMRKHGFTGVPIEQRASMSGHEAAYSVVYRNFSRNIHSTDYLESYLKAGIYDVSYQEEYLESRDVVAHYVAHFSAVGMVEFANGVFDLGLEKELAKLGQRQKEIKAMKEGILNNPINLDGLKGLR